MYFGAWQNHEMHVDYSNEWLLLYNVILVWSDVKAVCILSSV